MLLELKHSDIGPFSVSLRLLPSPDLEITVLKTTGLWHHFRRPLAICIKFACEVMMGGVLWPRYLSWISAPCLLTRGLEHVTFPFRTLALPPKSGVPSAESYCMWPLGEPLEDISLDL